MQNKGLIRTFAIIFGIICVYYLSFTWINNTIEDDAKSYAQSSYIQEKIKQDELAQLPQVNYEQRYLDSISNLPIVNYGFAKFTYSEVQDLAINLGLDLKGGIDATVEVSVRDILYGLSNKSSNPIFNKALANATAAQKDSDNDYLDLFYDAFDEASNGSVKLSDPSIFGNKSLKDKINFKLSDDEVKPILKEEVKLLLQIFLRLENLVEY